MVSANPPHTDAADGLRVEQAVVVRVNQVQHAILKHQQHPFALWERIYRIHKPTRTEIKETPGLLWWISASIFQICPAQTELTF